MIISRKKSRIVGMVASILSMSGLFANFVIEVSMWTFVFQAKEMVTISKSIASKIEQKQGNITEDEVCARSSLTHFACIGVAPPRLVYATFEG